MFDNEIDWVTCSGERFRRREAHGRADVSEHVKNTRPSTCNELVQVTDSGKCSSKKSVFRSNGDHARERTGPCSEAENRLSPNQDRSDSAPCAGVNSMVKLLRAHGGCLGRDRR